MASPPRLNSSQSNSSVPLAANAAASASESNDGIGSELTATTDDTITEDDEVLDEFLGQPFTVLRPILSRPANRWLVFPSDVDHYAVLGTTADM